MFSSNPLAGRGNLATSLLLAATFAIGAFPTAVIAAMAITDASWDQRTRSLRVVVAAEARTSITLYNANDPQQILRTGGVGSSGTWRIWIRTPDPIPCRVRTESSGESAESDVQSAPNDCAPKDSGATDTQAPAVSITSNPPGPTYTSEQSVIVEAQASDNIGATRVELYDNGALQETYTQPPYGYQWNIVAADSGPHQWSAIAYDAAGNTGTSTLSLSVSIEGGGDSNTGGGGGDTGGNDGGGGPAPDVSINSTSQSPVEAGVDPYSAGPVTEEPAPNDSNSLDPAPGTGDSGFQILAVNDLGMHCGDLDTRVASILPPFQVMLSQVIRKGESPELLGPSEVEVFYSAASNPDDPILSQGDEVFTGLTPDDKVYKSNFWSAVTAYDPFYPPGLLCSDPANPTTCAVDPDTGLPVPNVEDLYIGADGSVNSGDEHLVATQHAMPGGGDPYIVNDPQLALEHYGDKPFFVNFPFGYVANDLNWFEGAGIPLSVFDDFGRENPYPLVRAQAKTPGENGQVLATVDTVLPISGEASCKNCHGSAADVGPDTVSTAGAATEALSTAGIEVASSLDDELGGEVPVDVSVEYATDINILRLHDLKHGADYVDSDGNATECAISEGSPNGNENCLTNKALEQGKSVVCQTCHYTPALDLAQVGPLGGIGGPADADANGRAQRVNKSNSRVMHHHHGSLAGLFPAMPAPTADGPDGLPGNHETRQGRLDQTCYQCHPGTKTKCLRGAMADGGMVCQDCHGGMLQVGNDFSERLTETPFPGGADLSKRVPWANEPGCGSCHTGDALDNLADPSNSEVAINALDGHGNPDGIRLIRAYLDSGDATTTPSSNTADTTPIVPSNKRFAEPVVPASFNGFANPGAGNPKLYRVSTGHGGVFCEGCHGATHAEWDSDGPPILNDNQTAIQLQGHAGTITECSTCHTTSDLPSNTQGGPHGMHLVNDIRFWKEGHKGAAKRENGQPGGGTCGACHGSDHSGTVLSRAAADRAFTVEGRARTVEKGEPIACDLCHSMDKSFGD